MANESIPLAQKLNLDKIKFPVYLSEKLDGVPVRFVVYRTTEGKLTAWSVTRQNEVAKSTQADLIAFVKMNANMFLAGVCYNFVWEVTHETFTEFKDISGVVRRQEPQDGLVYNLFDYDAFMSISSPELGKHFAASGIQFDHRMRSACEFAYSAKFRMIPQCPFHDREALEDALENTPMKAKQEGWIIRGHDASFKPGKRHWDYQKIVKEPMIDLRIVDFEEGKGKNAKAVGRLIAEYKGKRIGVGPGKLDYEMRRGLWVGRNTKHTHIGMIAQIKHKPDDSYEALRQPTFQCWRPDKTEPDA